MSKNKINKIVGHMPIMIFLILMLLIYLTLYKKNDSISINNNNNNNDNIAPTEVVKELLPLEDAMVKIGKYQKSIKNCNYYKELYFKEFVKYTKKEASPNCIVVKQSFDNAPSINTIITNSDANYQPSEIDVICSVVEAETHGADYSSKVRIVHVIRNRVNDGKFPSDYYSVCTQSGQFASRWDIEESTRIAVNDALNMGDTTNGALWFCTCSNGCWASNNATYLFTDSVGHHFWK